jgi:hypothetical protein
MPPLVTLYQPNTMKHSIVPGDALMLCDVCATLPIRNIQRNGRADWERDVRRQPNEHGL